MFPRLREQVGVALDLVVEFSTLGEYRLGVSGTEGFGPIVPAPAIEPAPRLGGLGREADRAAVRRAVPIGVAAFRGHGPGAPATPAARRRHEELRAVRGRHEEPRRSLPAAKVKAQPRRPAPAATEQLCFAGL